MEISDAALDAYFAKDYYGPGTDYFEPPEYEECEEGEDRSGRCLACGEELEYTGIWVCCKHCGRLQVWPSEYDHKREDERRMEEEDE